MKNVLFATTAIVAFSAAAASAQTIELSGFAEIGITSTGVTGAPDFQTHTDVDLVWKASGTTDGGLTWSATIDWDEAPTEEAAAISIGGAFGTITGGDTDGAYDAAMFEIADGGLAGEADNANGHSAADNSVDDQILRYSGTFGPVSIFASMETGDAPGEDSVTGVGARFSAGAFNIAVASQDDGTNELTGVSATGSFGPAAVTVAFEDDAGTNNETTGISVVFDAGAATVGAQFQTSSLAANDDVVGAWVNYPLGGGATAVAAFGSDAAGNDKFGFGVGLSF